eukprot:TRINITY_DN87_c0_g1_i1.p1 TRINITY_DN87_c0_g1~~TRINITY_DN87_c0_g1_i1.p1  ORF type:complete len:192 (-),score=48.02 TRINITY_DN87_c0_g1_i1:182-757(-)
MTEFGRLALVIGDYHTPQRKADVPRCFKELLNTDKIGTVICTGNVGSQAVVEQLQRQAGEDCHIVLGDADHGFDFPETAVTTIGDFKVGIVHGHQIIPWGDANTLAKYAGRLGVDILVSGHTHRSSIVEIGGKFLINPGSVTGACNACGEFDMQPSFMLMAITDKSIDLYTYELQEGQSEPNVVRNELKKS